MCHIRGPYTFFVFNPHCHFHDDVKKWNNFPRYWSFVRGIHRSRWFPLTKANDLRRAYDRDAGDLRRHLAHYDVSVMFLPIFFLFTGNIGCYIKDYIWCALETTLLLFVFDYCTEIFHFYEILNVIYKKFGDCLLLLTLSLNHMRSKLSWNSELEMQLYHDISAQCCINKMIPILQAACWSCIFMKK